MARLRHVLLASTVALALTAPLAPINVAHADHTAPPLVNVLRNKTPTGTNATVKHDSGDPTIPQQLILNPSAATDGDTNFAGDDSNVTKILAGIESKNPNDNNGFNTWQDVYLDYDLGQERSITSIKLFHNAYSAAASTFKNVKVEIASTPDFGHATILTNADFVETQGTHMAPQLITPDTPVSGRYVRIWKKGHFIQNFNGNWSGYSNGVGFREIEVFSPAQPGEEPQAPPTTQTRNIASGKIPYVYGLAPTNIEAISDGTTDGNVAIHNSLGKRWLQFEYRNLYRFSRVVLHLEPGTYSSIDVEVRHNAWQDHGTNIYSQHNVTVSDAPIEIAINERNISGKAVRFTIEKDANSPVKYREVEIWASGTSFDESMPAYVEPRSEYNQLVWSDEFNGDTVDESKWNIIDKMANHAAIYNRGAVRISKDGDNSYLAINSKNYPSTQELINAVGWDQYGTQTLDPKVTWSSGRVESKNKFSFQYGRMAVRAKPNDSQGIWPAIWMLAQDETGHDEIDVLEYLGQHPWGAWTTNHYGILGKNKASAGKETMNYEAWSQNFHVFEVEWNPDRITWFIDGKQVYTTTDGAHLDSMHSRPMFPILETQVGDGWVRDVDYTKQATKQESDYLIDWVRIYQKPGQAQVRFDDLAWDKPSAPASGTYDIHPHSSSDHLRKLSDGSAAHDDKDNFFYGGQPRYETSRLAAADTAIEEQFLVYEVPTVQDVHLTTYYQTIAERNDILDRMPHGHSVRENFTDRSIDFRLARSADGTTWTDVPLSVVDNFVEPHPGYARTTFDAYNLPKDTRYVKVIFPAVPEASTSQLKAHDIQLAKVTFLQREVIKAPKTPTQPTLELSSTTARPGDELHFSGKGFTADETVTFTVHSTPLTAGVAHADAAGNVALTWRIPEDFTPGTHHVIASTQSGIRAEAPLTVLAKEHIDKPDNRGIVQDSSLTSVVSKGAPARSNVAKGALATTGATTTTLLLSTAIVICLGMTFRRFGTTSTH